MTGRAEEFHRLFLLFRIEAQRDYYTARSAEYRRAHEQAVVVRNVLLLAAAVAGGMGPFVHDTPRAALGVAAAVLGALAAAVTAFETLIGFPQLEKLYADAARNLKEAAIDWREADPGGDLTAEIERVEDVFRSERGQWGQLIVKSAAQPPPARNAPAEP
ncbi:MAG: SLATT domain-containing protein [Pseudonocardia sp.]|nr:SLATT domain-containing protein [Pseudonocardia sp.]